MQNREAQFRRVIDRIDLDQGTFELRFERRDTGFVPGQHLSVGAQGHLHMREYSVYSSVDDDYLSILVKAVPGGFVSPRLATLAAGDQVYVEGPFGFFGLEESASVPRHWFLATGTGISPFVSMIRSRPGLDWTLVHGTRYRSESFGHQFLDPNRLVHCTSRDPDGPVHGRVQTWLKGHRVDPEGHYYLCGNCDMIYDVFDHLTRAGLPAERIHTEVYF